jgi:hypothetical protein
VKRGIRSLLSPLLALVLAACAAPEPVTVAIPSATPGTGQPPDLSCRVAEDCEVKNVGNCCGYFPACVNRNSTVDPEAVRAECARTGTSSVCGFPDIQACDCVQGQCRAVTGPLKLEAR